MLSTFKNPGNFFKGLTRFEGILFDFDGIIALNTNELGLKFLHNFLSNYHPISYQALFMLWKYQNCFNTRNVIISLLDALGLKNKKWELYTQFRKYKKKVTPEIIIDEKFFTLIKSCRSNNISLKILSMSNRSLIEQILKKHMDASEIINIKSYTKANFSLYDKIKKQEKIDLEKWILIDDDPLALCIGKQHGLTTVFKNGFYHTNSDCLPYDGFIDYKISELTDIFTILEGKK